MHETLALRLPFEGSSNYETAKKVCEAKREPPSKYNPAISAELDALSLAALAVEREDRIPSARDFQSRLLEILSKLRPNVAQSRTSYMMDFIPVEKLKKNTGL